MKNNGYEPSIMQEELYLCYLCGRHGAMERHEIFGGANRSKSKADGLWVCLCHQCHNEPPNGVHHNAERMQMLHEAGQRKWMEQTGGRIEDFRERYGKNYL